MNTRWGVERGALWALDLPARDGAARTRPGIRFAPIGAAEAAVLAAAMDQPESEVVARLARGSRVIAAWQGGDLASYCWISVHREHVGELARDLLLPAGESYVWDCATVPKHRGQGLYRSLLRQIAETLAAEGQRRVWIGASTTNDASNRTFTTVGFLPAASVVSLRLGGRGLLLRFRGAPGADPALVAAARRVLTGRDPAFP
ncbi:MAG: GNAT family N-acetyltransferase [Chloroflexi bacterium]|nr:MAG: GNAT family N-acetyltransferase [Chloroflexota bacterium]